MSEELISKQAVLNLIDVAKNTPLKMYRGLNKYKTKLNSVMKLLEDSVNMLPDETVQIKGECMKNLYEVGSIPDDEVLFCDGILYIICHDLDNGALSIGKQTLDPQYDEPISLADIAERYPNIEILIHESWFNGEVFRYNNYGKNEWVQTGQTRGFA